MKKMSVETIERRLREGKMEMHSDVFGSTTKYAEVRMTGSRKVETIEVLNYKGVKR